MIAKNVRLYVFESEQARVHTFITIGFSVSSSLVCSESIEF